MSDELNTLRWDLENHPAMGGRFVGYVDRNNSGSGVPDARDYFTKMNDYVNAGGTVEELRLGGFFGETIPLSPDEWSHLAKQKDLLRQLQEITCNSGTLTHATDGHLHKIFAHTTNLKKLDLQEVPRGALEPLRKAVLPKLEKLHLSAWHNEPDLVTEIVENLSTSQGKLTDLNLAGCELEDRHIQQILEHTKIGRNATKPIQNLSITYGHELTPDVLRIINDSGCHFAPGGDLGGSLELPNDILRHLDPEKHPNLVNALPGHLQDRFLTASPSDSSVSIHDELGNQDSHGSSVLEGDEHHSKVDLGSDSGPLSPDRVARSLADDSSSEVFEMEGSDVDPFHPFKQNNEVEQLRYGNENLENQFWRIEEGVATPHDHIATLSSTQMFESLGEHVAQTGEQVREMDLDRFRGALDLATLGKQDALLEGLEVLNLNGQNLSRIGPNDLAEITQKATNATHFNLSGTGVPLEALENAAKASSMEQLRHLDLSHNPNLQTAWQRTIGRHPLPAIVHQLHDASKKKLELLNVEHCNLGPKHLTELLKPCQFAQDNEAHLFNGNKVAREHQQKIIDQFNNPSPKKPASTNIAAGSESEAAKKLAKAEKAARKHWDFEPGVAGTTEAQLRIDHTRPSALSHSRKLKKAFDSLAAYHEAGGAVDHILGLQNHAAAMTGADIRMMASHTNMLEQLKSFSMWGTDLSKIRFEFNNLAQEMKNLEYLDLSSSKISDVSVMSLSHGMPCDQIHSLSLAHNPQIEDAAWHAKTILEKQNVPIKYLDLDGCKVEDIGVRVLTRLNYDPKATVHFEGTNLNPNHLHDLDKIAGQVRKIALPESLLEHVDSKSTLASKLHPDQQALTKVQPTKIKPPNVPNVPPKPAAPSHTTPTTPPPAPARPAPAPVPVTHTPTPAPMPQRSWSPPAASSYHNPMNVPKKPWSSGAKVTAVAIGALSVIGVASYLMRGQNKEQQKTSWAAKVDPAKLQAQAAGRS